MTATGRRIATGSTSVRLALALAVTQILTLALGLAIMAASTRQTLLNEARVAAEVARDDLLAERRIGGDPALARSIGEKIASREDRNFVAFLRGADGSRLAGNLEAWPKVATDRPRWATAELARAGMPRPEPVSFVVAPLPGGKALLTGEVLDAQDQVTRASERSFVEALLVGLVMVGLTTWLILRALARRIDEFSLAAGTFADGGLGTRIELSRSGDAFDRLGGAINAALDRVAALVGELRAVTDSMAHDLRSPVARMRYSLERAFQTTDDTAARAALADSIDEADGLQRLLDTALEISRSEAGLGRDQFSRFDLSDMLRDLAEVYGPLAEDEGFEIAVEAPPELAVRGHRELLFRAISNLIDNALKYATGGSRIALGLTAHGEQVRIVVSDDGPGIEPERHDEALRRFGRLDPARTRSGAGLGMALVGTIASLHGGTMELGTARPRGLEVAVSLPIAI